MSNVPSPKFHAHDVAPTDMSTKLACLPETVKSNAAVGAVPTEIGTNCDLLEEPPALVTVSVTVYVVAAA